MILNFGKRYRGYELSLVPTSHLEWALVAELGMSEALRDGIDDELDVRLSTDVMDPRWVLWGKAPAPRDRRPRTGEQPRCRPGRPWWSSPSAQPPSPSPPEPDLAHIERIVKAWYRRMINKHHPDRGGTKEAAQVINEARDVLRELAGLPRA